MKAIKIGNNSRGERIAICQEPNGYGVWRECQNYASHCRGGLSFTWRYIERGLSIEEAEKIFVRRTKPKPQTKPQNHKPAFKP